MSSLAELKAAEADLVTQLAVCRREISRLESEAARVPSSGSASVPTTNPSSSSADTAPATPGPASDAPSEEKGEADWEGDVDAKVLQWKTTGNSFFSAGDYDSAVKDYTRCVNALKKSDRPPNVAILANRSASYLALKKFVPASWDAQCAAQADPTFWKAHWRHGVALMSMAPRTERSEQAVGAFERCAACATLPKDKVEEVNTALDRARVRLQEGKDKTPLPQQCQPS